MKILIYCIPLITLLSAKEGCHKPKTEAGIYKGRLEIKGICMNYTIKVLSGGIDSSLVNDSWTDETTRQSYTQVFALGSRCSFPASLQQGDEFLFKIDTTQVQNCAVCLAYYPTPPKRLSIKVIEK